MADRDASDDRRSIANAIPAYDSYTEAREHFLRGVEGLGALTTDRHVLPLATAGEDITMDVAVLGDAGATSALVILSGTHGVEGFAGSGLQWLLLEQLRAAPERLAGLRLVLIHALNPWGFAMLRRVDQDNIDINRNFVDHQQRYPVNHHYQALKDVIDPVDYGPDTIQLTQRRLYAYAGQHGPEALKQAVQGGQYVNPRGMFFGGHEVSWSRRCLDQTLQRHLGDARRVVVLDLHTGLGEYGQAGVLSSAAPDSGQWRRTRDWWGSRASTTARPDSPSAVLSGPLKQALPGMLSEAEVTAVTIEFGTLPPEHIFAAMQVENWHTHYGGGDQAVRDRMRVDLKRAFFPDDPGWRESVAHAGMPIMERALEAVVQH